MKTKQKKIFQVRVNVFVAKPSNGCEWVEIIGIIRFNLWYEIALLISRNRMPSNFNSMSSNIPLILIQSQTIVGLIRNHYSNAYFFFRKKTKKKYDKKKRKK